MKIALVLALAACGGKPAPAAPPPPPPPLAQQLRDQMLELEALTARTEHDCKAMAQALGPLFDRMRVSVGEAKRMRQDPDAANRLTTDLRRYDAELAGVADRIAQHLAPCQADPDVRDAMVTMPTL